MWCEVIEQSLTSYHVFMVAGIVVGHRKKRYNLIFNLAGIVIACPKQKYYESFSSNRKTLCSCRC